MRILSVFLLSAALLPHPSLAQHTAMPSAFSLNYTAVRANSGPGQCGCFYLQGGSAEIVFPIRHFLDLVGELAGDSTRSVNGNNNGLSLLTYTAGPRLSVPHRRLQPFVQALIGGAHGFQSFFPLASSQGTSSANSLALLVGGGGDLRVSSITSVRLFQADYLLTQLPNGSNNRQNNLRLGAGVSFRFGAKVPD